MFDLKTCFYYSTTILAIMASLGVRSAEGAIMVYETFDNGFVNDGTLTGGIPGTGAAAGNYVRDTATQVVTDANGGVAYNTTNSLFRSGLGGVTVASRNGNSGSGLPPGITSYPLFTGLTRVDTAGNSATNAYMVWNDGASSPLAQVPVAINEGSVFMISFDFYEPTPSPDGTTANFALTLSNGAPVNGSGVNGDNRLIDFRFNNGLFVGLPFTRDTTHHVDFVGNVSSTPISYGPGNAATLAGYSTDVYVDGVLFANDVAFFHAPGTASVPATGTVASRFGFFMGSGSGSSTQVMYIDNFIMRDDLVTAIPEPSTLAIASLVLLGLGFTASQRRKN